MTDYNKDNQSFDYKFKQLQHNRSDFTRTCNVKPFEVNCDNNITQNNFSSELLKGHISDSGLSKHFFSKCNLDYLQNLLIKNIYNVSKGKYRISRQSDKELLIIMRQIYLNEALNNDDNIILQVNLLNNIIIKKTVPPLLSNISQHNTYLQKINNPLFIMDHPKNVNSSSNRTTLEGSSNRLFVYKQ